MVRGGARWHVTSSTRNMPFSAMRTAVASTSPRTRSNNAASGERNSTRKRALPRITLATFGYRLHDADRSNRLPCEALDEIANGKHQLRRIATQLHRRLPGMINLALERDRGTQNPDNAHHRGSRPIVAIEDRSLRDVHLEVGTGIWPFEARDARHLEPFQVLLETHSIRVENRCPTRPRDLPHPPLDR